ncbi:MAG: hypothetical protein Q8N23_30185 [Archangium sp.]|nr:hypothetical protein [Archangium sp.]MDP3156979.1 hypothetical protein [Archangium sp.]MDP3574760.1 hypothetical protein [Archangium sp.]
MTVKIQRGRQFLAGDVSAQLFDDKGKAGTYLSQASAKLVAQTNTVLLKKGTTTVKLATADDWKKFIAEYVPTKAKTADFTKTFGITFEDFCNVVDDVAVSDDKGLSLNLSPNTNLSKALSLDKVEGNYASKLTAESTVKLSGIGGVKSEGKLVATPVIGPEILAKPIDTGWDRNRTEQEAWADFKVVDGANRIFRETGAIAVFDKMTKPKWDDPAAMELVEKFTMPMHLEQTTKADGTVSFQDKDEMFRETYFDDASGALEKAGASVRARVRFDDKPPFAATRVLIQGKEGRAVDADGNSAVHKFEKRFEGTYTADEAKAQDMLRNGKDTNGEALEVAAILYKTAQDKGTLPMDKNLRLDPKSIVLQKRRRSHMQFESVRDVQGKRTELKTEMDALKTAGKPIPAAMQKYDDKLAAQEKFLTDAGDLLKRHGQYLPSNTDGFIISADRYSVYDPAARKEVPTDIDDETGRVGRGLHLEAEWDTASSDPFEKALKTIETKLAATPAPANKSELEADRAKLKEFSKAILKDVATAVDLMKAKMEGAGLKADNRHLAKEERAAEFMKRPDRPVIWQ